MRSFLVSALVFLGLFGQIQTVSAKSLECRHLNDLFQLFLRSHYLIKNLNDDLKKHTVDKFINSLDPSKTTLLKADVEKIRTEVMGHFAQVQAGTCSSLDQSYKILAERTKQNEEFIKSVLTETYKLDESVEIQLDPEKRGFPNTVQEKQAVLTKMIHFQVSSYEMASMTLKEAKKQLIHRYELATKRLTERKADDLISEFAESFAVALDPHSSYFTQDSLEDFQISMRLSLEGIGASLSSEDGFTVVEEIIPGGSADREKALRVKDKIIAVAQEGEKPVPIIDMDLRRVVSMIRGKKGTKVHLTVVRQTEKAETVQVAITRDKIDIRDQAAKITYETRKTGKKQVKIGVIELPSFYGSEEAKTRSASTDMKNLLEEAKKEKVDGIVLNLSKNGGGLLEEAVKISGLFIHLGNVVATQDTDRHIEVLPDKDPEVTYTGPLVVLISRMSASASEILAGALKDYGRAVIVGSDHTFGKGSVQILRPLPQNLGAMKVTVGMFFRPSGVSTQHLGVASDVVFPSFFNGEEVGEKALDYSLPPQKIAPFLSSDANAPEPSMHWKPISPPIVSRLVEQSKTRVAKEQKFVDILKEFEESKKNKGLIKIAELKKKDETRKAKEKDGSSAKVSKDGKASKTGKDAEDTAAFAKKAKERELPIINESVNILTDLVDQIS